MWLNSDGPFWIPIINFKFVQLAANILQGRSTPTRRLTRSRISDHFDAASVAGHQWRLVTGKCSVVEWILAPLVRPTVALVTVNRASCNVVISGWNYGRTSCSAPASCSAHGPQLSFNKTRLILYNYLLWHSSSLKWTMVSNITATEVLIVSTNNDNAWLALSSTVKSNYYNSVD